MFVPESLRKQNELIRALQKQLRATERELANQNWILQQYLNSPSWKLTAPLRWIVRQLRAIKSWIAGDQQKSFGLGLVARGSEDVQARVDSIEDAVATEELKELYTSVYRVALQAFLTSNAVLQLPSSSEPAISIILVLFNRAELTLACLRSIREEFAEGLEVVIVDNASTDLTPHLLSRIRGARIIRNSENRNFLLAVNQAAREARGRYLLLLNNDAQLMPGSLRAAVETIESDWKIGAVGGRIILYDGTLQEAGSIVWRDGSCLGYGRGDNPFASSYMFRRDVDYCSGAFLLTRRATWEKLKGFDEAFVPAYYEETDYCVRLWEHGLRVVYEPSAVLLHYEFASSKPATATELQANHQQIFATRHSAFLENHSKADVDSVLRARICPAGGSKQKRILFIDDRVPHPWLGSGFPRARTMLLALRRDGFFITFFPMALHNEDWSEIYSDLPRDVEVMNEMGPPLLEAFLRHRRGYYDAIMISRPHNMNYLKPIAVAHPDWFEETAIIYDAEALFAPRDVGLRQLRGEQLTETEVEQIYQDEVGLTCVADCVIAVSELDRVSFESRGVSSVHVVGHSLDLLPMVNSFEERSGFLFVGAIHEEASPNGDSMIWFLSEIWPRIQAQIGTEVPLTIAGVNNSERIRSLGGNSVRVTGHLPDIAALYGSARVFIAPTRYAAGIPHKVHEASARGLPVVATAILAAQLKWSDGVEIAVAQDAATFAEKCVELHRNKQKWTEIRTAALTAVRRDCSRAVFEARLHKIFAAQQLDEKKKRYADAGMDR